MHEVPGNALYTLILTHCGIIFIKMHQASDDTWEHYATTVGAG